MNPTIDLSQIYNIFFNVQNLAVLNPDGTAWTMEKAIMRVVNTDMSDNIGDKTYGQRTKCNFLFFRTIIPAGISPQINSKITDNDNTDWYVSNIENMYFGNVLKLHCESQAGIGVQDEQFPVVGSSTTTTSTTPVPGGCQDDGTILHCLELDSQLRVCAQEGLVNNWFVENQALDNNQTAAVQFVVNSLDCGNIIDVNSDASGMDGGSAVLYINNVPYGGNHAGTVFNYSTGVTIGDVIKLVYQTPTPLIYGAISLNAGLVGAAPTTSSSTSTSSTSTSTSTSTTSTSTTTSSTSTTTSTTSTSTTTSTTSTTTTTAAPFTPASISNLLAWFDWSDTTTLFQDSGGTVPCNANNDPIGRFNDKSGNNRFCNTISFGQYPELLTNYQNGLSVAYFRGLNYGDGSRDAMGQTNIPLSNNFTMIFVTTVANAGPNDGGNSQIIQIASGSIDFEATGHGRGYLLRNNVGTLVQTNPGRTNLYGFAINMFDYDGNISQGRMYAGSNQIGTTLSVGPSFVAATPNCAWNGNGDGSMYIAEAIFYGKTLSASERIQVRNYLEDKWGI